ncbi:MAG: hypothetical protein ACFB9M_04670 [Myxococcota bacterium]
MMATLLLDIRRQTRSGLYVIGFAVSLVLGLGLRATGASDPALLAGIALVFLGGTTFLFAASMLLSDRSEGTLHALRTSPLRPRIYLLSKIISLTAFSAIEASVIVVAGGFGWPTPSFTLGTILLGVPYVMLALGQASATDSMTSFLFPTGVTTSLTMQLPVLGLIGVGWDALWMWIPSQAAAHLMAGSYREPFAIASFAWWCLASAGLWIWALRRFDARLQWSAR